MPFGPLKDKVTRNQTVLKDFVNGNLYLEKDYEKSARVMLTQLIKNEKIHNIVWLFLCRFKSLVVQQPGLNMLCQSYLLRSLGVCF